MYSIYRPDQEALKKNLENRGVMVSHLLAKNMSPEGGEQTLKRLLGDEATAPLGGDLMSCITGVAGYLELMSRSDDLGKYRLIQIDSTQHVQLDEAAVCYGYDWILNSLVDISVLDPST